MARIRSFTKTPSPGNLAEGNGELTTRIRRTLWSVGVESVVGIMAVPTAEATGYGRIGASMRCANAASDREARGARKS